MWKRQQQIFSTKFYDGSFMFSFLLSWWVVYVSLLMEILVELWVFFVSLCGLLFISSQVSFHFLYFSHLLSLNPQFSPNLFSLSIPLKQCQIISHKIKLCHVFSPNSRQPKYPPLNHLQIFFHQRNVMGENDWKIRRYNFLNEKNA
jgi:hypothetical protein